MLNRIFLLSFLSIFIYTTLSLFLPIIYYRYEINNYLKRFAPEVLIQTDLEAAKNLEEFLPKVHPEIKFIDLKIIRNVEITITLTYQQNACLKAFKQKTCLFPVRSNLTYNYKPLDVK